MAAAVTITNTPFPYNPASDIPGCVLWLDANDLSTITFSSGSKISTWFNKVTGTNNATQANAANQPTLSNNGVIFNGTSNYMSSGLTIPFQTHSMFVVYTQNSNIANAGLLRFQNGATYIINPYFNAVNGYASSQNGALTAGNTVLNYNNSLNVQFMAEAIIASNTQSLYKNSILQTTNNSATSAGTSDSLTLGCYAGGPSYFFAGIVNEILIYSNAVTSAQRQKIEMYLGSKWNLPGNYTYPSLTPYPNISVVPSPIIANELILLNQPSAIPGCVAWFDAIDSSTMTFSSGSKISTWSNKVTGLNNATQGNASFQPTFSNKSVIFNGTSNAMPSSLTIPVTTHSIFIVYNPATFLTNQNLVNFQTSSGATYINTPYYTAASSNAAYINSYGGSGGTGGILAYSYLPPTLRYNNTIGTTSMVEVVIATNTQSTYLNGTLQTTASVALFSAGTSSPTLTLGAWPNGGAGAQFFQGTVNEILIYSNTVTDVQRQQIEGYLSYKWSLPLPSTHSYYIYSLIATSQSMSLQNNFNPLSIPLLVIWIDASASNYVSGTFCNGVCSNVTGALDRSGNGRHLTGGSGFSWNVVPFNGKYPSFYCGTFSNGNTGVGYNNGGPVYQPATYFYVGQANTINGTQPAGINQYLSGGPYIGGAGGAHICSTTAGTTGVNINISASAGAGTTIANNANISNPFVMNILYYSASPAAYLDGASLGGISMGTYANTQISLGYYYNPPTNSNQNWCGHICELLIYSSILTTTQRQQIEGYLSWKWGITGNLISSHPNVFMPP